MSGLHSYINCIESGKVAVLPSALPGFTAVTKWLCEHDMTGLSAELVHISPKKKKETLGLHDDFGVSAGVFTLIMGTDMIEFKDPGIHEIQVVVRHNESQKVFKSTKHPLQIAVLSPE
jgi:hypothetical protein